MGTLWDCVKCCHLCYLLLWHYPAYSEQQVQLVQVSSSRKSAPNPWRKTKDLQHSDVLINEQRLFVHTGIYRSVISSQHYEAKALAWLSECIFRQQSWVVRIAGISVRSDLCTLDKYLHFVKVISLVTLRPVYKTVVIKSFFHYMEWAAFVKDLSLKTSLMLMRVIYPQSNVLYW